TTTKAAEAPLRTWTDISGTHHLEARLGGVTGDSVRLDKPNGTSVSLPLAKLSQADQDFVKQATFGATANPPGSKLTAGAELEKDEPELPGKPIPEAIAEVWKKAGAKVGWWGITNGGMLFGDPEEFELTHVLPAVKLSEFDEKTVATLPDPGVPFAI